MTHRKEDGYKNVLPTRIRNMMDKRKMKIMDLAKKTGISRQSIGYYADGSNVPDAEKLALIANALDVSADYLIGLTDNENSAKSINLTTCADAIKCIEKLMSTLGEWASWRIDEGELIHDAYYEKDHLIPSQLEIDIRDKHIVQYFSEVQRMNDFFSGVPDSGKATASEYMNRIRNDLLEEAGKFDILPF